MHDALTPRSGGYDVLHVEHLRAALYGLQVPAAAARLRCRRLHERSAGARPPAHGPDLARARATARGRARPARGASSVACSAGFDRVLADRRGRTRCIAGPDGTTASAGAVTVLCPTGSTSNILRRPPRRAIRPRVVFVGRMGYHANLAAARQLLDDIMPRVWARAPDARLLLVGADPPARCAALAPAQPDRWR